MRSFAIPRYSLVVCVALLGSLIGCEPRAKVSQARPAPVPAPQIATTAELQGNPSEPPPAPIILFFAVEPLMIEPGQTATIKWMVRNATSVAVTPGPGNVALMGEHVVTPTGRTEYRLTAKGPGGSAVALAEIAVASNVGRSRESSGVHYESPDFGNDVPDVYFDFDSAQLRTDAAGNLRQSAAILNALLRQSPALRVTIGGHSDERGSAAYNLALAAVRADHVRDFLVEAGLSANRLVTISYGSEAPVCSEPIESCWHRNRRVHISPTQ